MKSNKIHIVLTGLALLLFAILIGMSIYSAAIGNILIFVLSVLVLLIVVTIISIYVFNRKKVLHKIYQQLRKIIISVTPDYQEPANVLLTHIFTFEGIENQLYNLERGILDKTGELVLKNKELNKQQDETLLKHKELSIAYEDLKESQERFEKLVENLEKEYFFYGQGVNGNLLYVSPSVQKILGYTVSEFKTNFHDLFTDNPINIKAKKNMQASLSGNQQPRFIIEVFAKERTTRVLEILEKPIFNSENEIVSIEGLAHNITEKFYAEKLIKEQEEKYRQVFNNAFDFIYIYSGNKGNKPGKIIEANEYMLSKLGYTQEEIKQFTPDDLVAADIWKDQYDLKNKENYERIWESKNGEIFYVEISEHSIKVKNNNACIAVARDITKRKRDLDEIRFMNEELINQKENLEALLDNLTQTQEQLVQSEKMAALGQLIAGVAHEINTPLGAIKASVGNLSDSLNSALSKLPSLFSAQSEENLKLFLITFDRARIKGPELSSREQREKKRAIRKHLNDKGIESAELIADLLAYLTIYDNYDEIIDLLKQNEAFTILKNVRDFISLLKNTQTIFIASEKASKVVFALKKYAHRDSLGEKVPTDIVDGIETVLTLYDNQLKQGIKVIKNYDKIPMVMCYQDEINQVWTNLIQNAIHAMGNIGNLTLTVKANDKRIKVIVADTGEGIEPAIREKIFEPFYTTKKQGEGSGLGLDIVKKIIDKHSGSIDVESEIGEGSSFIIQIPAV